MKWNESPSNRVFINIIRYIDHMKFAVYVAVSFITVWKIFGSILYHCTYGCIVFMLLFHFVNYVFLLLCLSILIVMFMYSYGYVCSLLGILFHCVVLCIVCV